MAERPVSTAIESRKLALRDLVFLATICAAVAVAYGRFVAVESELKNVSAQIADLKTTLDRIAPPTVATTAVASKSTASR